MPVNRVQFGATLFNFFYEYDKLLRRFCREANLYNGQPRILTTLNSKPGCTLSELSSRIGVGMPSLSVSIRSLKRAGLVCDDGSGRNRKLFVTEEGQRKAIEFHKIFDSFLAGYLDSIGAEREEKLDAEFRGMAKYMRNYREDID